MMAVRQSESKARAPRYRLSDDLMVASKTIGTALSYRMSTVNISRSGLLLSWESNNAVPFIENTILEMTIDPDGDMLDRPVNCLGKVVRKAEKQADGGRASLEFGIRIVQIDGSDLDNWETCIEDISQRSERLVDQRLVLEESVVKRRKL